MNMGEASKNMYQHRAEFMFGFRKKQPTLRQRATGTTLLGASARIVGAAAALRYAPKALKRYGAAKRAGMGFVGSTGAGVNRVKRQLRRDFSKVKRFPKTAINKVKTYV
jgi:hypothetical protein